MEKKRVISRKTKRPIECGDTVEQKWKPPKRTNVMEADFFDGEVDMFMGEEDLRQAAQRTNEVAKEFNEHCFDPSVFSYDFVSKEEKERAEKGKAARLDWNEKNIEIKDEWFVPQDLNEVVDNKESIFLLDNWLKLWTATPLILPKRCICMLKGPPGTGKTTAARLALQKHGFTNIIEINASSEKAKTIIGEKLEPLLMTASGSAFSAFSSTGSASEKMAIVLEEVDGAYFSVEAEKNSKPKNTLCKFFASGGYKPINCDPRGLESGSASFVSKETWQPFRSSVPIILVANESFGNKSLTRLAELSLLLPFVKIREQKIAERIVTQLSMKLNIRWALDNSGSSGRGGETQNGQSKGKRALFHTLIQHSCGDMRKASALMQDAVRAAYTRRLKKEREKADEKRDAGRKEDADRKEETYLVIQKKDCPFFGASKSDVLDTVPTLFGAARFLLCEMEKPREWEQAQKVVSFGIQALPFMLFENMYDFLAEPVPVNYYDMKRREVPAKKRENKENKNAAAAIRKKVARKFSEAESLRQNFLYVTDPWAKEFYLQLGVVLPCLACRFPEDFIFWKEAESEQSGKEAGTKGEEKANADAERNEVQNKVERPAKLARLNIQKSVLDGESGNSKGTLSKAKQERDVYVRHFGLPYQIGLSRWYRSDNFVSKLDETRAQGKMMMQDKKRQRTMIIEKTKMSDEERKKLFF